MPEYFSPLLRFVSVLIGAAIIWWLGKSQRRSFLLALVAAAIPVLLSQGVDKWLRQESDPKPHVKVTETSQGFDVTVSQIRSPVKRLAVDVPVFGRFDEVINLTSTVNADAPSHRTFNCYSRLFTILPSIESAKLSTQDNLELVITNIRQGAELHYSLVATRPKVKPKDELTLLFTSLTRKVPTDSAGVDLVYSEGDRVRFHGDDRFRVAYTWTYGGDDVPKEPEYFMMGTGQPAGSPKIEIACVLVYLGALPKEDIDALGQGMEPRK